MMLGARTGAWANRGTPLPYDAEVEWIKNVVGSYIDTGVIADSLCNISCSFILDDYNTAIYGVRKDYFSYNFGLWSTSDKYFRSDYWTSGYANLIGFGIPYIGLKYEISTRGEKVFVNNSEYSREDGYSAPDYFWSIGENIYLFCINNFISGHSIIGNSPKKITDFTVEKNNEILIALKAVRFTNEDGVSEGAMFDGVSGQLFRNAGTGAFIIGPDK